MLDKLNTFFDKLDTTPTDHYVAVLLLILVAVLMVSMYFNIRNMVRRQEEQGQKRQPPLDNIPEMYDRTGRIKQVGDEIRKAQRGGKRV